MTQSGIIALTAVVTLAISTVTSIGVLGYKIGQLRAEIESNRKSLARKADMEDVRQIKETLAEIKGMFVLRLREEPRPPQP